jgi:hypothetical protein
MPTQATYRKERSSAFWHFLYELQNWPVNDFHEISTP